MYKSRPPLLPLPSLIASQTRSPGFPQNLPSLLPRKHSQQRILRPAKRANRRRAAADQPQAAKTKTAVPQLLSRIIDLRQILEGDRRTGSRVRLHPGRAAADFAACERPEAAQCLDCEALRSVRPRQRGAGQRQRVRCLP